MRINFIEHILDENYFNNSQDLYDCLHIISNFSIYQDLERLLSPDDSWTIKYEDDVGFHLLWHSSYHFRESRPICYIDHEKYSTWSHVNFIAESLKEAWVEYFI